MLTETGQVIKKDGHYIWVETKIRTHCDGCHSIDKCSTGRLARYIAAQKNILRFATEQPINIGQKITVGIPEEQLLTPAFFAYLFPLIGLFLFAIIGQLITNLLVVSHEGFTIISAIIGSYLGFRFAKFKIDQFDQNYQPDIQLVEIHPETIPILQIEGD